jgi:hypothetical protein
VITPFKIPAFSPATPPPPKSIVEGGFKIHFIFYIVTFGGARALFSTVPVIVSCFGRFSVFSLSLFFSHPPPSGKSDATTRLSPDAISPFFRILIQDRYFWNLLHLFSPGSGTFLAGI